MKKLPLLALALTLLCLNAKAQMGIKGGINLSSQYTNNKEIGNQSANFGFQGGLVFELPMTDRFSIQPELLYTRKGAHYDVFLTDVDANMGYVEVPVLAVFKPLLAGAIRLHLGPQFSYLANVEYEFRNELSGGETEVDTDRGNYNQWDIGAALGTSVHLGSVFAELRFTQGFRSIEKPRSIGGIEFGNSNLKNFSLQVSAGLMF